MKTRHHFEYKRHHGSMAVSFIILVLAQTLQLQYLTVGLATRVYEPNSAKAIEYHCLEHSQNKAKTAFFIFNEVLNVYLHVPDLMLGIVVGYLKKSDDIL
jgi:hypothetical protein